MADIPVTLLEAVGNELMSVARDNNSYTGQYDGQNEEGVIIENLWGAIEDIRVAAAYGLRVNGTTTFDDETKSSLRANTGTGKRWQTISKLEFFGPNVLRGTSIPNPPVWESTL